jgi:hypothetical protein
LVSFGCDLAVSKDLHDDRLLLHDTPLNGPPYTTSMDAAGLV